MLGNLRARCSVADTARIRTVLHVSLPLGGNRTEVEVPKMPPTFQHNPSLEWLALGGHNDAIILAPGTRIVFAPVQLEAGELQFIKSDKQVFRPLVAIAAFPDAMVNEEIIENRRPEHPVFPPQFAHSSVGTL